MGRPGEACAARCRSGEERQQRHQHQAEALAQLFQLPG